MILKPTISIYRYRTACIHTIIYIYMNIMSPRSSLVKISTHFVPVSILLGKPHYLLACKAIYSRTLF